MDTPPVMLATPGRLPTGPGAAGWVFEVKWDGVRALLAAGADGVRVTGRHGRDATTAYPELAVVAEALLDPGSGQRDEVLLDGEVVALDAAGRPDFGLLQSRMHVSRPAQARVLARTTPVTYVAFDLLHAGGRSYVEEPYDVRRAALEALVEPAVARADGRLLLAPAWPGDAVAGADVLAAAEQSGMEGVVAKRRDSRYEPGRRSPAWVKVKAVRRQSVVVGGWEPGQGGRAGQVGALLVGVVEDGRLVYAGQVGTGFSDATLRLLQERLAPLRRDTPPFDVPRPQARTAVWVEPVVVAEVELSAWTRDGRLRHPSFQGLRDDVDPADCVREVA